MHFNSTFYFNGTLRFSPRDRRMASTETSTADEQQFFLPASRLDASLRLKPRGRLSQSSATTVVAGGVKATTSKVTVPKPFRMTLREERKRRRVRTRSEVELENALLKRELEELRECGRKFRVTPAPAHTRRPLCEVVAGRPSAARRSIVCLFSFLFSQINVVVLSCFFK